MYSSLPHLANALTHTHKRRTLSPKQTRVYRQSQKTESVARWLSFVRREKVKVEYILTECETLLERARDVEAISVRAVSSSGRCTESLGRHWATGSISLSLFLCCIYVYVYYTRTRSRVCVSFVIYTLSRAFQNFPRILELYRLAKSRVELANLLSICTLVLRSYMFAFDR